MKELPKAYDPAAYEDAVYAGWEKSGAFQPVSDATPALRDKLKPYTIIMPPPNATGVLHTGHAIMLALEDALIRYHRMKGFDTLYLPGTDHAAIATENVVERQLIEEGTTKQSLGRPEFVKRAKKFALENKSYIESQFKAMGASADWSRNAFTMDKPREQAVKEAFRRLYKKGLIYRGSYMVNWCPHCRTVLADDEVEHREQEGVLYYMRYGPFELATTRPETKVGDTAVAVHPKDKRYKKYVGQSVDVQTINGVRQLQVIADEMVDPEFGTGVVKITPFHDRNDYAVYERHPEEAGPPIEVIGEDGRMTAAAGKRLAGLDRFEARAKMVEWLKSEGLLLREELHQNSVGRCYRSDDVIEPRISQQWFLKVSALKEAAAGFVDTEELKFVPKRFEKTYRDWITNLHDWCISRQVWFGHPVPVYLKGDDVSLVKKAGYTPSTDTLDTWFSSALWPFSTMGWPEAEAAADPGSGSGPDSDPDKKPGDFQRFFPGDVLETGYDIIPFWVSRMVLMTVGLDVRTAAAVGEATEGSAPGRLQPPFHTAYLHGMVRDKRGRKFSKSLGNGVDPLELIGKYGADALRFMLTTSSTPGNDVKFDEDRVVGARNFANKLWNVSRFVLSQPGRSADLKKLDPETLTTFDRAILHKLYEVAQTVEAAFYDAAVYDKPGEHPTPRPPKRQRAYDLAAAGNALQTFVWSEFADWYVEAAKVQLKNEDQAANTSIILRYVTLTSLQLLHPLMPFITEVLWQQGFAQPQPLIGTAWPELHENLDQPEDAARYEEVKAVIETIRRLRAEHGTPAAAFVTAHLATDEPAWLLENSDTINALARLKMLRIAVDPPADVDRDSAATAVAGSVTVTLPLAGLVDAAARDRRLQSELEQATLEVKRLAERLANKDYVSKAPAKLVAQTKETLAEAERRRDTLQAQTKAG